MNNIIINVSDKIAAAAEEYILVCGNIYNITFNFDSEWNEHEIKTVRFTYSQDGVKKVIDKAITGNTCETPIFSNINSVAVGVFAGNLTTTTPCILKLEKSILCGGGIPEAPEENIYSEIVSLCSEAVNSAKSVEERANKGYFNGKDGAPGKDGSNYILTESDLVKIANVVLSNFADVSEVGR